MPAASRTQALRPRLTSTFWTDTIGTSAMGTSRVGTSTVGTSTVGTSVVAILDGDPGASDLPGASAAG